MRAGCSGYSSEDPHSAPHVTELTDTLKDLIEICRDGRAFYLQAAEKIEPGDVRSTLLEMARVRQRLLDDFSELLLDKGQAVPVGGTLSGRMRRLYADLRAQASTDAAGVYVVELEEAEDRLLQTFESAMLTVEAPARIILRRYIPLARDAHERMKALKSRRGGGR